MHPTDIGRLVKSCAFVRNLKPGEPDIRIGTLGRVMRVDDIGVLVNWQLGQARPTPQYVGVDDLEMILVEDER